MSKNFFDFTVQDAAGKPFPLKQFAGKPCLVINVASKCGYTPQYAGLEALYKKYSGQGLQVIGFPCNQFGGQEPGTDSDIQNFCQMNYGVSFPVLAKVDVNGSSAAPVYEFLKSEAPGILGTEAIKWNFTKFLVGKDGKVLERYAPTTKPEDLSTDIEKALA
jgi:glutathione peroxidase